MLLVSTHAHASLLSEYEDFDGDGWSTTRDGVLTIESDQGWANCMKHGYKEDVVELVIGKDVTSFRLYSLPDDPPSPDFFNSFEVVGYDSVGNPIFEYFSIDDDLFPRKITIEDGNKVFRIIDGLLINIETNELVLSETGVQDVVVPDGVKTITKRAFYTRYIDSVRFPKSLESIQEYAFAKCVKLTTITLPNSLVELSQGTFYSCDSLEEVELPPNLTKIGHNALAYTAIQSIEIPSKVTLIGSNAFSNCERLESVALRNGLMDISMQAFWGCSQLREITLPEGLESIGISAFNGCKGLKSVLLPDSLRQIGGYVYRGCDLDLLCIPAQLDFLYLDYDSSEEKVNSSVKKDKTFGLSSVDTVIFTGSDYDFGYHAITDAKNVYFLSTPPEEVGEFLDKETVENIYCSDEYEFQWTRSKVASWVRQKLTILPAAEINALAEEKLNTTPTPLETPAPTPSPTPDATPVPTPKLTPASTPTPQMEQGEAGGDPLLIVFAGVLALVVAGIVVVSLKSGKKRKRKKR